jgi:hypothetical protein
VNQVERELLQFEGLIAETARQIVAAGVELEIEDVRQLLRVKAWRAIAAYDARRDMRLHSLRRFVFGCLYNLRKDIEKRPRRHDQSIEEQRALTDRGDRFDARYLSIDADSVYFEVEEEDVRLPSTLTAIERYVVALRLQGLLLVEIDRVTGLSRPERERVMRSVREKLADWAPAKTAATPSLRCDTVRAMDPCAPLATR